MSETKYKNILIKIKKRICKHEFIKTKTMYNLKKNEYIDILCVKANFIYTCKKCGEEYFV